jgi:DNA invertase Pin-like site-specific DNA recombinase
MQAIGYVRVSTQEQADSGAGLDAQRAAIEAETERRAWTLVAIHEDAGASGKSIDGRPGLQAALEAVEAADASGLVVAKLDRLSRSLLDFAALMERARRNHWSLVALDLGVDTSTPAGEMMAAVLATFAQFERRIIGQRTRDALAVKRAQGVQLGRPRTINDATVRRILELRSQGLTLAGVADVLNERDIPTPTGKGKWHPSGIARALGPTATLTDRFGRDGSGACDA